MHPGSSFSSILLWQGPYARFLSFCNEWSDGDRAISLTGYCSTSILFYLTLYASMEIQMCGISWHFPSTVLLQFDSGIEWIESFSQWWHKEWSHDLLLGKWKRENVQNLSAELIDRSRGNASSRYFTVAIMCTVIFRTRIFYEVFCIYTLICVFCRRLGVRN